MPEPSDKQEKRPRGRPNVLGPCQIVPFQMPNALVEKMKTAAAEADITAAEHVRRAVDLCSSSEEMKQILRQLYDDDEIRSPALRKYRNEIRRKAGLKPKA